ncbi:MAG: retropepsin-like domain-containing protein [Candidatus Eremiobacteraeota bacterium]|nr:retropepsin-like domain-containing protein [Candidatus Eremiobacteraeota bacterium]
MVAAILCASAAAMADDASDLLAKHKAYVGWQFGDGTFRTLTIDSSLLKNGTVEGTYHEVRMGAVYRETATNDRGTRNDGFTGNIFWSTNLNGFPRPVRGDEAKYAVSLSYLFNEGTTALMGADRGTASIDGQSVRVVRVGPEGAFPIDLYIDPSSGAYRQAVIDPEGTYNDTLDILGYTDALPGKKIIATWKHADSSYSHRVDKVVANGDVTTEQLHPPAPAAYWEFKNDQPFKIEFIDRDAGPRIHVMAKVNGVLGTFLLDTGASDIFLSRAFADKANVKRAFSQQFSGVASTLKGEFAKADTVEIGGNVLHDVLVGAGGQPGDRDAPDGLIGFDLFAGAIVNVSLDNQTMTILDPKTHEVDHNQGITVAADLSQDVPIIPMMVEHKVQVNALLDSGGGTYMLFNAGLLKYGVSMLVDPDPNKIASHLAIGGIGGGYEVGECGNLDNISVGPIVYDHVPACSVHGAVAERQILVGLDFLKGFNMLFDYPDSYLILIPRKQ